MPTAPVSQKSMPALRRVGRRGAGDRAAVAAEDESHARPGERARRRRGRRRGPRRRPSRPGSARPSTPPSWFTRSAASSTPRCSSMPPGPLRAAQRVDGARPPAGWACRATRAARACRTQGRRAARRPSHVSSRDHRQDVGRGVGAGGDGPGARGPPLPAEAAGPRRGPPGTRPRRTAGRGSRAKSSEVDADGHDGAGGLEAPYAARRKRASSATAARSASGSAHGPNGIRRRASRGARRPHDRRHADHDDQHRMCRRRPGAHGHEQRGHEDRAEQDGEPRTRSRVGSTRTRVRRTRAAQPRATSTTEPAARASRIARGATSARALTPSPRTRRPRSPSG